MEWRLLLLCLDNRSVAMKKPAANGAHPPLAGLLIIGDVYLPTFSSIHFMMMSAS